MTLFQGAVSHVNLVAHIIPPCSNKNGLSVVSFYMELLRTRLGSSAWRTPLLFSVCTTGNVLLQVGLLQTLRTLVLWADVQPCPYHAVQTTVRDHWLDECAILVMFWKRASTASTLLYWLCGTMTKSSLGSQFIRWIGSKEHDRLEADSSQGFGKPQGR